MKTSVMDRMEVRYLIATLYTMWMGNRILFHNSCPWWSWGMIALTAMMAVFSFSIAEKFFWLEEKFSLRKVPVTIVAGTIAAVSSCFALWQLIDHMLQF